ncbi:protein-glutamate O-methyltransferase CheR [Methylomonas sp. EFPC1]|uniref:protein-glutamate O-methyltransferase n=1 Tax=Methylomonas defluvii TaxID=3045149 RepID=A0ABU4UME2_9GAMM|nr:MULTISPECIES: protein-glutamate O-methyltransferase CheR [unclassified Methylomonas]MDX8130213.1 protein-glutamate O-methyltransferase CheR [Methylomonas sp. OY6]QBC28998.1 protein-glutamate O-methyltransferase CheR [Methylomonas sp. LW13]QSB00586.1 protein-glutamate O-methyltransferase CheR [Methylomonas sp. EFPC1]
MLNQAEPGSPAGKIIDISAAEYQTIQQFLSQSCGIELGDSKQYLVKSRLLPLMGKFEFTSFAELANSLQSASFSAQKIKSAVIDAMTTNETFWFRDERQFVELKDKVLPGLLNSKNGNVRVWSAACSSGQEPYSIGICALEAIRASSKSRSVQIIGTDISEAILEEAKRAVYSEAALSRGLDSAAKARYFHKNYDGYLLSPEVSQLVRFQQFNLLKSFTALGRFDLIFCRNVLIYFSDQVKRDILSRMADSLEPGGYLFLSSTEAMPTGLNSFELVRSGLTSYFKKIG